MVMKVNWRKFALRWAQLGFILAFLGALYIQSFLLVLVWEDSLAPLVAVMITALLAIGQAGMVVAIGDINENM